MTKKNIVLVLIFVIFLSVMAISIWGKDPEPPNKIEATALDFYDSTGTLINIINEESDDKEKIISREKTKQDYVYYFSAEISPENTTDPDLVYDIVLGECTLEEIIMEDSYRPVDPKAKDQTPQHSTHYHFKATFKPEQQTTTKIRFLYNTKYTSDTKKEFLQFTWTEHHESYVD